MSPPFQLDVLHTEGELRALAEEWTQLYAESVPRNPFLSHAWAVACWENVCSDCELYLLTARHEGRLVGLAPLRRARQRGFRVLQFIGSGWSEYTGFLVSPRHPRMDEVLLEGLRQRRREWDLLVLRQLSDTFSRIHQVTPPKGLGHAEMEAEGAPYLTFAGDWEALHTDGPSWVKRHKRFARVFARDGGTVVRYVAEEAARRMDEVAAIEAHSWKARYGDAAFQRREVRNLLVQAFLTLGQDGGMELWIAYMEDRPAAYHINFVMPERIGYYRTAYDEQFKKWSPGGVVNYHSLRSAWEAGLREYDFMSGMEPYKKERANAVRALKYRAIFPTTARGWAAYALLIAPRWGLRQFRVARRALDFVSLIKAQPQALLPWNRQLRARIH